MTTKTVKQIVDEYLNRDKNTILGFVMFSKNGKLDGYSQVANLYRDGDKVNQLGLDTCVHKYEFDSKFIISYSPVKYKWNHHVFSAQIIEYTQKIEE